MNLIFAQNSTYLQDGENPIIGKSVQGSHKSRAGELNLLATQRNDAIRYCQTVNSLFRIKDICVVSIRPLHG